MHCRSRSSLQMQTILAFYSSSFDSFFTFLPSAVKDIDVCSFALASGYIGQLCKKASQYAAYSVRFAQISGVFIILVTFHVQSQLTIKLLCWDTIKDAININPQHRKKKDLV